MRSCTSPIAALLVCSALVATGCGGRIFNPCGCGPLGMPLRARLAPPDELGPHPIQPPHSRFHPVPTRPVFVTQAQHLEEVPRSALPHAPAFDAPEPIERTQPSNRRPRATPGLPKKPLEKVPTPEPEDAPPENDAPPLPPASGSSGVTLNPPSLATPASEEVKIDPYAGWRPRAKVR
jgi:hypothetical protein